MGRKMRCRHTPSRDLSAGRSAEVHAERTALTAPTVPPVPAPPIAAVALLPLALFQEGAAEVDEEVEPYAMVARAFGAGASNGVVSGSLPV